MSTARQSSPTPSLSSVQSLSLSVHSQQLDEELCAQVLLLLQNRGTDAYAIKPLRHLLRAVKVPDAAVSLPDKLVQQLLDTVLGRQQGTPPLVRLLSSLVLQQVLPSKGAYIRYDAAGVDESSLGLMLPLLLLQSVQQDGVMQKLIPQLVRWVSTLGYSYDVQSQSLHAVVTLVNQWPQLFSKEHIHIIDVQLSDWLRKTTKQQAANPHSRGFFKSDQQGSVTELDGAPCQGIFTILCLGKWYCEEQLLNAQCFSLLRQWMLPTLPSGQEPNVAPVSSSLSVSLPSSRSSPVSQASDDGAQRAEDNRSETASLAGEHRDKRLMDTALLYCLRVVEQCDLKPKVNQDVELQHACLFEAVRTLDLLCQANPDLTFSVCEVIKKVAVKVSAGAAFQPRNLLATLQFFLNHSGATCHNVPAVFELYFDKILATSYGSHALSFDTVTFLQDNLHKLSQQTQILSKYFPNILKILAWNPRCFLNEFMDLVPAFMSETTAIEVFHAILDLPCLTAALEWKQSSVLRTSSEQGNPAPSLAIGQEPKHRPFLNFILRNHAGFGDTIDRLGILHAILGDWERSHRVAVCCDVALPLLCVYIEVAQSKDDFDLASRLVPVILERSGLLYGVAQYQEQAKKYLADALVQLFQQHPHLMINQYAEILDYISNVQNLNDHQELFTTLLWIIGEYLSCQWDSHCTPDVITKMYEALETLSYEVTGSLAGVTEVTCSVRMLTTMMSTLAKLASRSQDLIPRVILCLTRLGQEDSASFDRASRCVLHSRANELVSLLKLPNVAAAILSPSADLETGRWHLDASSLPSLLQTTSHFLQART